MHRCSSYHTATSRVVSSQLTNTVILARRRHATLFSCGTCLVLVASCQPSTSVLTEDQKTEIADTVNRLHAQAWDAVERADVEDFLALWHDARETTTIIDGAAVTSWSTYEMFLRGSGIFDRPTTPETALRVFWQSVRSHEVTIGDSRTTVLAPDVVHVLEQGRFVWTDTTGTVWPAQRFAQSTVWVQRDSDWKMLFSHYSAPATGPG